MYSLTITCRDNLYDALKLEETESRRFCTKVARKGNKVEISVNAEDATALKGIGTSILRLLEVGEKVWQKKK